jgi:VanZ family protein
MRTRILLILAALIVYGSLYPFNFVVPPSNAAAWDRLLYDWTPFTSRGDALGNLGLFVPFGFAAVFSVPGRSRSGAAPGVVPILIVSFALATALQIAQIYFPPRTPAMADVIWNMIGAGLGIAAGWLARGHIALKWRGWQDAYAIPLVVLALWFSAELLPFVPSLDLQAIKNSVKALARLHLSPFDILWHAAGVLVAGRALKAIVGTERTVVLLAMLIAVVIAGKVLVVTRVLNASTLAGCAIGYAVWCFAWASKRPLRGESAIPLVLLAAFTLKALEPFELTSVPADFNWIPFARMLQGSMIINSMVLVESVFVFAGVLGLARMQGARIGAITFVLALWVGALETIQMYLVGRTPDITEPLLAVMVGLLLRSLPAGHPPGTNRHASQRTYRPGQVPRGRGAARGSTRR